MSPNDPQDSTPYEDEGLIVLARHRLWDEFEDASSDRVMKFLSSVEISELVHMWYNPGLNKFGLYLDALQGCFADRFLNDEIDLIVEESKQAAAEAYADYLSDR